MAGAGFRAGEIRRHNLALVLDQVHRHGPLSRAELTERVGLKRSTVRSLVVDLTRRGLLSEIGLIPGGQVGRPSSVVGSRTDGPYAIAVDITADRIISAAIGLTGDVLTRRETALGADERDPAVVADLIATECGYLIRNARPDAWTVGMAVSVPGTVTREGNEIRSSPDLGWRGVPFVSLIGVALLRRLARPLPIELGNAADLGLRGEHVWGAARGCDDVVYLTTQNTLGVGVLVNGQPVRGHLGLAGEIAHLVLDPTGPPCWCGNRGCVESFLGRHALDAAATCASEPLCDGAPAGLAGSAHAGQDTTSGQQPAMAEALGRTIALFVAVLNPQRVLLGGALSGVLEGSRSQVEAAVNRHLLDAPCGSPQLCSASLGQDSSLLGAAELAFQTLFTDPSTDLRVDREEVSAGTARHSGQNQAARPGDIPVVPLSALAANPSPADIPESVRSASWRDSDCRTS